MVRESRVMFWYRRDISNYDEIVKYKDNNIYIYFGV